MKAGVIAALLWLGAAAPSFAEDVSEAHALSGYARYELRDIAAQVAVHPRVMNKLTTELKLKLDGPLAQWNAAGGQPGHTGAMAIEVSITDMKFVSGGKRAWAGGFAGNSHSAGTVKLIDVESGKVLHSQDFKREGNASAGAWSFGASDNAMLEHLAADMANWVITLHDATAATN